MKPNNDIIFKLCTIFIFWIFFSCAQIYLTLRMTIHANCANLMTRSCPMLETRKEKPMPTTSKNQRFASPMLR